MSLMRYVVKRSDGWYWCGSNRWSSGIAAARWFATRDAARNAGLRDLADEASAWSVELGRVA